MDKLRNPGNKQTTSRIHYRKSKLGIHSSKLKLRGKLLILFTSVIFVFSISIFIFVNYETNRLVSSNVNKNVNSSSAMGMTFINQSYGGSFLIDNGKMYKGENPLEDNESLADKLLLQTGAATAIYRNDTCISTSIKDSKGNRLLGIKAPADVTSSVIGQGKEYAGEVLIDGRTYICKYIPVHDENKKVIGMLFSGIDKSEITKTIADINTAILIATILIIILAYVVTMIFVNKLLKNFQVLSNSINVISTGDLTEACYIKSNDEIKDIADNLNSMRDKIRQLISNISINSTRLSEISSLISSTSQEIGASTEEIYSSVTSISEGASNQAAEIEKCVGITNSLSEMISDIIQQLDTTISDSMEMKDKNKKGLNAVEELKDKLQKNTLHSNQVAQGISDIAYKSGRIESIISTINNIAEQTNLLSLNASIEAARAGDAGKGFSVVANEIRKLSENSRLATGEIADMIKDVKFSIDSAQSNIKDGENIVQFVNQSMYITETAFIGLTTSIEKVLSKIDTLKEHLAGIDKAKAKVVQYMDSILVVSEESAVSTEKVSASAMEQSSSMETIIASIQEQNSMIDNLSNLVSSFKL